MTELNLVAEDNRAGQFTKDMRVLPSTKFFKDRVRNDAKKHAEEIKEAIVEKIIDSKDGRMIMDLNGQKVPARWHEHFKKCMNAWANMSGYKIDFNYEDKCITQIDIYPKGYKTPKVKRERKYNFAYWALRIAPFGVTASFLSWAVWGFLQSPTAVGYIIVAILTGTGATIISFATMWDEVDDLKRRQK